MEEMSVNRALLEDLGRYRQGVCDEVWVQRKSKNHQETLEDSQVGRERESQ